MTVCQNMREQSPKKERKERKALTEKDFYLAPVVLSWPQGSAEMFLPRPPVALCVQEAGGRDTLGAVLLSLPAPSRKSIHPTTVVDRHKQQRLVDLLRHINMLWAKGARSSGRALQRDAPGPAPHGHGAISGPIVVPARLLAIFHEGASGAEALLDSQQSLAPPPAITWICLRRWWPAGSRAGYCQTG